MAVELDPSQDPGPQDRKRNQTDLTPRQVNAAALLAIGTSRAEVCRKIKCSTATLYDWLKQQSFRDKVDELRNEVVDRAIGRLADLMAGKAIDKLIERLDRTDPDTGVTAATLDDVKAAFDLFGGLKSNTELAAKLDKLLERLGEGK